MRRIICGMSSCTILFHIILQTARLLEEIIECRMYAVILSTDLSKTFVNLRRN